jgi:Fe-S-cluster containining protein
MSLTLADVARLERAGWQDFFAEDDEGYLRLRTVGGRCLFLDGEDCKVYPDRPEGCVLYPLVVYEDPDAPGADRACPAGAVPGDPPDEVTGPDGFCPYSHEFRFSAGDREWLCRSVAREEQEVARRRASAR